MSLLAVSDLGLRREGSWTLRGVSFEVRPGEAWGLVGESGAGKTTLTHLLLGLLEPSEGSIRLKGEAWSGTPERQRRPRRTLLQAVFQDPLASLPPHRTGWEILQEPLDIWKRGTTAERREAAARMAARVKFPEASLQQRPGAWSGGLAQRLALARALMLRPELLVLDEPLSALDPTLAGHLLELLLELKAEGLALILVSHDLPAVKRLCDRLLVLYGGETMCQGPAAELLSELRHPYLRGLWEAVPDLDRPGLPRRWGVEAKGPRVAGGCLLMDRCPRAAAECAKAPPFGGALRCHRPWD
ncbi:MAG TPA: ATP-binding cassette domain-containing protein [Holophagaceae bacterium]|nr:ATP-binding cassette domain-containing protein [Holophagaceae bacterium]